MFVLLFLHVLSDFDLLVLKCVLLCVGLLKELCIYIHIYHLESWVFGDEKIIG